MTTFNKRGMKRRRGDAGVIVVGKKRTLNKEIICVTGTAIAATQNNTTLLTCTFPGTIVGLRWDFNIYCSADTGINTVSWMIHKVKSGVTTPTISQTGGSSLIGNEEAVMAWGGTVTVGDTAANGDSGRQWQSETKTMRKLQGGDILVFSCLGSASIAFHGYIQFFMKTA